jgi:Fe-S cluster biogenesis protein NfuA
MSEAEYPRWDVLLTDITNQCETAECWHPSDFYRRKTMTIKEKVEKALNDIRPSLQADGGNVELVDVENDIVKVRLTGACAGCPMSQMTLKHGVEQLVKRSVPEVSRVEAVD